MRVEVLFLPGCPKYQAAARSVHEALVRSGASEEIELTRIATAEDAERRRFLGSPTVRVDGRDVDPGAGDRDDFGLKCRLYRSAAGTAGAPRSSGSVLRSRERDTAPDARPRQSAMARTGCLGPRSGPNAGPPT
jgi:hypothetical protein